MLSPVTGPTTYKELAKIAGRDNSYVLATDHTIVRWISLKAKENSCRFDIDNAAKEFLRAAHAEQSKTQQQSYQRG